MKDLKNKNIIITGATGGIGNSIIHRLNDYGANILASGTKDEKLKELKSKFENIKILKFDISQSNKIEELLTKIKKLQEQNKGLLKIIEDMNEEDEFQDCLGE